MKSVELAITIITETIKNKIYITQFDLYQVMYAATLTNIAKNKYSLIDEPLIITRLGPMYLDTYESFNHNGGTPIFYLPGGFWATNEKYKKFYNKEHIIYNDVKNKLKELNVYNDIMNFIIYVRNYNFSMLLRNFLIGEKSLFKKLLVVDDEENYERVKIPYNLLKNEATRFINDFHYEEYLI